MNPFITEDDRTRRDIVLGKLKQKIFLQRLFYSDDTLAEDRARMRSPQYQKHTGTGIRQIVTAARIVVERGTPSFSNI